jgi:hypothetical protein
MKLTGTVFKPRIDGTLDLNQAGLTVNYLKTPYKITDKVYVENSVIKLNDLVIKDIRNNEARANGSVDMENPNNPTINVVIKAKNFMALNTRSKDNALYYGVAYGTGTFSFKGPTNNMNININAKTEAGTVFNIPLNASETVSDNNLITFVPKDSTAAPKKVNTFSGLVMNFDLEVDRNSEVNIYTDIGKLTGRGETESLNLKITSSGDFAMLGTYNIADGKFEFTAQDFINKVFKISQGGSLRWTGDPTEAEIDLKALYEVRARIGDLYRAAGREAANDQQVLSQAVMNLNGPLLQPEITFDINFPNDAYIKDELQGYLSDVTNKNQQALSLIVRRSFAPNAGSDIRDVAKSTLSNAGAELLFNQFNNILAQSLGLNFVDFNIRSFNEASTTLRLLNERLVFTAGFTDTRQQVTDYTFMGGNAIAHDVEALYLLKKDGSLVLRLSNRLNNRSFLDAQNINYISAFGLVYRKEFDSLNELLRLLIGNKRKEERKNNPTPMNNPPKTTALKPEDSTESHQKD